MAKNLKLICEANNIGVKQEGKRLYIVGLFQQAEKKNQNGRVYPRSILQEQVNRLQPKIAKKALFGMFGHPDNPSGNPSMISHRIDELSWSGNNLMGRALVLDTDMGKNLKAIIEAGSQIMISSRAVGHFDPETGIVSEDQFNLITFDIVEHGGVADAYVSGVYESKSWSPCEISSMLKEEEEEPGEEKQCICHKCWKIITTIRDCSKEHCPMCHREGLKPFPDDERFNKEPAKVYTCFCPNCQEYLHFRNMKCSETNCPTCRLKLKQEKVEDSEKLFKKQVNEWKSVIKQKELRHDS